MKLRIWSGGQTGCDQAAIRAALAAGLEVGGWCAKGWLTEEGPAPWLESYGLRECPEPGYPARTRRNVADATACLWMGDPTSPGGKLTLGECGRASVDIFIVRPGMDTPKDVARWLSFYHLSGDKPVTLLVAGNRESSAPGIGERAERFLGVVFRLLKEDLP